MLTSPDDLRAVRKGMIRSVFNISYAAISKWQINIDEIGADNGDGTYDLVKIIRWRSELKKGKESNKNSKKGELELEKMRRDIEYRESQITKIQDKFIERSIADQEKVSMLKTIRMFLERSPSYHKHFFHMIPADIAELRLKEYGKEACKQIASAPVKEDKEEKDILAVE